MFLISRRINLLDPVQDFKKGNNYQSYKVNHNWYST